MVTEDLKRLRKALDNAIQACDDLGEDLSGPIAARLRQAIDDAADSTDDITFDIRRIESDISFIYRML